MDQHVNETESLQWFLCSFGPSFKTFTTHLAIKPPPCLRELILQAESHKFFLRSQHGHMSSLMAFSAKYPHPINNNIKHGRGCHIPYGGSSNSRGCGHYATHCPNLSSYVSQIHYH